MNQRNFAHHSDSDNFTLKSLQKKLANLDAYPKTLEDFRIKTLGGATGLFLCLVIFVLFLLFYCIVHIIIFCNYFIF